MYPLCKATCIERWINRGALSPRDGTWAFAWVHGSGISIEIGIAASVKTQMQRWRRMLQWWDRQVQATITTDD